MEKLEELPFKEGRRIFRKVTEMPMRETPGATTSKDVELVNPQEVPTVQVHEELVRSDNSAGMVKRSEVRVGVNVELMLKGAVRVMVILEAELTTIWLLDPTEKVMMVSAVYETNEIGVVSMR